MQEITDYITEVSKQIASTEIPIDVIVKTKILNDVLFISVYNGDYFLFKIFNSEINCLLKENFNIKVVDVAITEFTRKYNIKYECKLLPNIVRDIKLNALID